MINDFRNWLDKEIADLSYYKGNTMTWGKCSEAVRIREKFRELVDVDMEKVASEICDKYCLFPQAYDTGLEEDKERMIEERCNKCPLNRVVK